MDEHDLALGQQVFEALGCWVKCGDDGCWYLHAKWVLDLGDGLGVPFRVHDPSASLEQATLAAHAVLITNAADARIGVPDAMPRSCYRTFYGSDPAAYVVDQVRLPADARLRENKLVLLTDYSTGDDVAAIVKMLFENESDVERIWSTAGGTVRSARVAVEVVASRARLPEPPPEYSWYKFGNHGIRERARALAAAGLHASGLAQPLVFTCVDRQDHEPDTAYVHGYRSITLTERDVSGSGRPQYILERVVAPASEGCDPGSYVISQHRGWAAGIAALVRTIVLERIDSAMNIVREIWDNEEFPA